MRLSAALPVTYDGIQSLAATFVSLNEQGFDEILLLWAEDGKKPTILGDDLRIVRTHKDFALEAAMHEATGDWVFIINPGERFESGLVTVKAALEGKDASWVSFGMPGEIRGFRRRVISNGGVLHVETPQFLRDGAVKPYAAPIFPKPHSSVALTVILPTWRLGGLDVTLGALAKQTFSNFEVILVDALFQWREKFVTRRLTALPFKVHHVPVDDSIFPISSHSRFRNTAIRRAGGDRVVFLSDYAVPDVNFLARHACVPNDTIGLGPWARTVINPESIACPVGMSVWDVVEYARRGEFSWSTFYPDADPFGEVIDRFPVNPQGNVEMGTQEYLGHFKADSVPASAVRKINGWDESFDGRGDCADTDFTLRLLWSGMKMRLLGVETPVLDAHVISVAPVSDLTRSNRNRLLEVRQRRMIRCAHGLERGIIND